MNEIIKFIILIMYCSIIISIAILIILLVNCAWGTYGAWTTCSTSCVGGTQTRTRAIATQAQNGGTACTGLTTETRDCNEGIACKYYYYY